MITLAALFKRHMQREFLLQVRNPRFFTCAFLFFIMIIVFFPLTLPAEMTTLHNFAPGLIWIALLLALLLTSVGFFQQDYEDGIIEQWLVSGCSLTTIIFAKITVHWLLNTGISLLLCPLLAFLFNLSFYEAFVLLLSLIVGIPTILLLCILSASFSTNIQQRGVLMGLIVLPLTVPSMIFGSATLSTAMQGASVLGHLALLLAITLLAVSFLPFAIAAVIRISLAN